LRCGQRASGSTSCGREGGERPKECYNATVELRPWRGSPKNWGLAIWGALGETSTLSLLQKTLLQRARKDAPALSSCAGEPWKHRENAGFWKANFPINTTYGHHGNNYTGFVHWKKWRKQRSRNPSSKKVVVRKPSKKPYTTPLTRGKGAPTITPKENLCHA